MDSKIPRIKSVYSICIRRRRMLEIHVVQKYIRTKRCVNEETWKMVLISWENRAHFLQKRCARFRKKFKIQHHPHQILLDHTHKNITLNLSRKYFFSPLPILCTYFVFVIISFSIKKK